MPSTLATKAQRIAIAQIPMFWEMDDNVRAMQQALRLARDEGAALCAFSELAVTGFHRRIVDWARPERAGPAVDAVRATAASLGIATAFGAPSFGADGRRYNSHLFVDADGVLLGLVSKNGLTAAEATFFDAGSGRAVVEAAGLRCTAVICREIEDQQVVCAQLEGAGVRLVLWPGQMRPDPAVAPQDPPVHVVQAQQLARRLGAFVVQTNWPNALNRPAESEGTGRSACIAPSGELLFWLPVQGFGLGVFELGSRDYRWVPCDGTVPESGPGSGLRP